MKLHRQVTIQEMTGPIPYELTLGEIIRDGDTTNHYQVYVLALLSEFFKDGLKVTAGVLDGLPPISSQATSVAASETIKSLSPSEKVNLATYLLDCVNVGNSALHSTQLSSSDWIRFVLQKNNN